MKLGNADGGYADGMSKIYERVLTIDGGVKYLQIYSATTGLSNTLIGKGKGIFGVTPEEMEEMYKVLARVVKESSGGTTSNNWQEAEAKRQEAAKVALDEHLLVQAQEDTQALYALKNLNLTAIKRVLGFPAPPTPPSQFGQALHMVQAVEASS